MDKKNKKEIVQVNIEAVIMTTDSKGRASGFTKHGATVAQSNFGITLEELTTQMLTELAKKELEDIVNLEKDVPSK